MKMGTNLLLQTRRQFDRDKIKIQCPQTQSQPKSDSLSSESVMVPSDLVVIAVSIGSSFTNDNTITSLIWFEFLIIEIEGYENYQPLCHHNATTLLNILSSSIQRLYV